MNDPSVILQARGLRKRYGAKEVVRGMDLSLRRGEILGLLGPNGAGKSTTVSMIAGLIAADGGDCLIDGQPVRGDADPRKGLLGLVPQELALHETLSAATNLRAFGALYGLSGKPLTQRVDAALDLAGLRERAGDAVAEFSGGMKRRLHMACALLHDPAIVILDEPTVGVDPQSRNAIFDALLALRDAGKALLYTTHYMEEAERLCERLLIMDHGLIVAAGRTRELLDAAVLVPIVCLELDRPAPEPLLQALRQLPEVKPLPGEERPQRLRLELASLDCLPAVLQRLSGQSVGLRGLHTERPSLEQLFLSLTGRQLRD
ncbi:ABC transporter ATP-binding protein [Roseateles sp. DB2]|uniref:ABC transporter ATP-binding protein n=1 Tax=Roseateles sp. DB2 TaxID=3453717 RepID=UPI003EE8613C